MLNAQQNGVCKDLLDGSHFQSCFVFIYLFHFLVSQHIPGSSSGKLQVVLMKAVGHCGYGVGAGILALIGNIRPSRACGFLSGHSVILNFPRSLWYLLVILQVCLLVSRTNLSAPKSSQMAFSRTFELRSLWFESFQEIWEQISCCIYKRGHAKLSKSLAQFSPRLNYRS